MVVASAPNKMHLMGEHCVVYGSWAILLPVEIDGKRNSVSVSEEEGEQGLVYETSLGGAILYPDGRKEGKEEFYPVLETAAHVLKKIGKKHEKLVAKLDFSKAPSGTGNSASIPVALALALYSHFNVEPSKEELFEAAFVCDNLQHGGKSSGGDVRGVLSDCPVKFRKVFKDGKMQFEFTPFKVKLPEGYSILLISCYKGEGAKPPTSEMIAAFAKAYGITKGQLDLAEGERQKIIVPFNDLIERFEEACWKNDGVLVGKLFEENHELLKKGNVTAPIIEEALSVAKQAGGLGGKLIGAGGHGGAAIELVKSSDANKVISALKKNGFQAWVATLASRGPSVDSD